MAWCIFMHFPKWKTISYLMESAQIQAGIVMRYSFEFQMHSNATNDVCLILNAHISMDFDVLLTGK